VAIALAIAALSTPTRGHAAPCAGFTDVDSASPFCANVEWLRNRKVTLGCSSATLYCPNDAVSRLQMAAFMNRLGTALTPVVVRVEAPSGVLDLDATPVVCQTADTTIADYPRRILVDAQLSASAASGVDIGVRTVISTDGGGSWTPLWTVPSRVYVPGTQWSPASDVGTADLNVGQTVRFGVQATRFGAGGADLTDSRCMLRTVMVSRDGTASPF
jgi:hypothetical protein